MVWISFILFYFWLSLFFFFFQLCSCILLLEVRDILVQISRMLLTQLFPHLCVFPFFLLRWAWMFLPCDTSFLALVSFSLSSVVFSLSLLRFLLILYRCCRNVDMEENVIGGLLESSCSNVSLGIIHFLTFFFDLIVSSQFLMHVSIFNFLSISSFFSLFFF